MPQRPSFFRFHPTHSDTLTALACYMSMAVMPLGLIHLTAPMAIAEDTRPNASAESPATHSLIRKPSRTDAPSVGSTPQRAAAPTANSRPSAKKSLVPPQTQQHAGTTGDLTHGTSADTSLPTIDGTTNSQAVHAPVATSRPIAELSRMGSANGSSIAPSSAMQGAAKAPTSRNAASASASSIVGTSAANATQTPAPSSPLRSTSMFGNTTSPTLSGSTSSGRGLTQLSTQYPSLQQVAAPQTSTATTTAAATDTGTTTTTSTSSTAPTTSTTSLPSLAASPSSLTFTLESGSKSTTPQTIAVSNSGGGTLTWAASNNQAWLSHSFTSTSVSVSASAVGLNAGTYTGAIMLWSDTATNAPKTIPVTLTVTAPATTPKIGLSPSALSFAATAGGSNPAAQAITVSNAGTGTLSWTVSDSANWLTATQAGSTVAATVDVTGLAAGTYSAAITVAATGAVNTPQTVPVSLTVTAPKVSTPSLATSPSSLAFTLVSGTSATTPQTIAVSNSGGGTLTWAASNNQAWLSHSFTNTSVSVSASAVGLSAGTYTGAIMLWSDTATNAPKTIPVTLTVTAPATTPKIGLSPSALSFAATAGGSNPAAQAITVSNAGTGTLSWTVSDSASWLTATQAGSTVAATVDVTGLAAGTYNAAITVAATGAVNTPQTVPVSLTVTAPKVSTPSLATSPSSVAFTLVSGTSATTPQTIAVSNSGGGTLTWAASNNQAWLSHSFTNTSVSVSASAVGLNAGTYTGAVMLWSDTATNAPKTIPVTLTVTAPATTPKIGLSPSAMSFAATAGGNNPAAQAITVSNAGTGTLSWTVSDSASWLTATQAGSTVAATVDVTGLAAGTYNAVITVAASGAVNTPQTVPVSLTVAAPAVSAPILATSPSSVAFTLVSGTSATTPQTIAVSNSGGGTLTWAASNNQAWLSHSFTNTSVSVSASAVGLSAGTYTGAVMLWSDTATNAPKTIPVTLTVTAPTNPVIGFSPTTLAFSATTTGSNPTNQSITISNTGASTLSWSVTDNASWLTATQSGNTVVASVNKTGLTAGTYSALITVSASGATNTPQSIPVSLTVTQSIVNQSVTLSWNANSEGDLAGYKIYRATSSGAYGAPIATVKGVTSFTATGLTAGTTYYFAISAYDNAGNESGRSNEVSKSIY